MAAQKPGPPVGCELRVRVIPRAKKDEIAGFRDEALVIKLNAQPLKGEANRALAGFLAKKLGIPRRDITLLAGETSRDKRLHIAGMPKAQVLRTLQD